MITDILANAGRSGKKVRKLVVSMRNTLRSFTGLPFFFLAPLVVFSDSVERCSGFDPAFWISEELGALGGNEG